MTDTSRSVKRAKHDFSSTFDVLVGQPPGDVKRFTVHTDVLTRKSKFLAAARKSEWLAGDSSKPVDLSDEDPDVFQDYLNCVYLGPDTLEESREAFEREALDGVSGISDIVFEKFGEIKKHMITNHGSFSTASIHFATAEAGKAAIKASEDLVLNGKQLRVTADDKCAEACVQYDMRKIELADLRYKSLISLYLLADKLQDMATVNTVMNKIQNLNTTIRVHPGRGAISIAYQSTMEGSALRKLLRDLWFYETGPACRKRLSEGGFPNDFLHDMVKQYVWTKTIDDIYGVENFIDVTSSDHLLDEPKRNIPEGCRYHQHDDEHPFCSTGT